MDIKPETWASDVSVSLPEPMKGVRFAVPMSGFAFTENGLCHDLNEADLEEMRHPAFGPERGGDIG